MERILNVSDFAKKFEEAGRRNQFSPAGLKALFDYITDFEESIGEDVELDITELCTDFREYDCLEDFRKDYPDCDCSTINDIAKHTTVMPIDTESFIIEQF